MRVGAIGQCQRALTLFQEGGCAGERAAVDGIIGRRVDLKIGGRDCAIGHNLSIDRLASDDELAVGAAVEGVGQCRFALRHDWRWWCHEALLFAQEIADMRRLVVARWLPIDGLTILRVVHQRVVAELRRDGRGVEADGLIVFGREDKLLAPVAQDVGLNAGIGLGRIGAETAGCGQ